LNSNHQSQEATRDSPSFNKAGIILLLLCSSFFALYKSNSAYTSDEVWSVKAASLNYSAEMAMLKADVHPPLYFQILSVWIRLFGTGERTVRSLSGLFYLLSGFAVYGIGRELYGSKTAFLCATLYLTSPLAILSAQFARMYSLLSLLSLLSTWLYLQFSLKPRHSNLRLAFYIFVNVLGTFTHIAFFFLLFGQIVFQLLFYRRTRLRTFAVAMVLSLTPYLLFWAPVLLGQINNSQEGLAWVNKPGLSSVGELVLLYGGVFWLLIPVLLYLWWRSGFEPMRRFNKLTIKSLPVWLLAITVLTPLLISQVRPIFNTRLAIVGLHLFALTIGAFIGNRANYFLSLELILLTALGLFFLHPGTSACDNRAMATYLSQTAKDDDVVIFTSLTRLPIDYYLERVPTTRKLFETSFPSEIDKHPGYEGRINDPARSAALEREARELVDKIAEMKLRDRGGRIFFFRGRHPSVDSILEKRLVERFELLPAEGLQCAEASPYFKKISVYR
jgi:uncharacterized membrane protein